MNLMSAQYAELKKGRETLQVLENGDYAFSSPTAMDKVPAGDRIFFTLPRFSTTLTRKLSLKY